MRRKARRRLRRRRAERPLKKATRHDIKAPTMLNTPVSQSVIPTRCVFQCLKSIFALKLTRYRKRGQNWQSEETQAFRVEFQQQFGQQLRVWQQFIRFGRWWQIAHQKEEQNQKQATRHFEQWFLFSLQQSRTGLKEEEVEKVQEKEGWEAQDQKVIILSLEKQRDFFFCCNSFRTFKRGLPLSVTSTRTHTHHQHQMNRLHFFFLFCSFDSRFFRNCFWYPKHLFFSLFLSPLFFSLFSVLFLYLLLLVCLLDFGCLLLLFHWYSHTRPLFIMLFHW